MLFRVLNEQDKKEFIQWADDHKDEAKFNELFHPVIIARWVELGLIKKEA